MLGFKQLCNMIEQEKTFSKLLGKSSAYTFRGPMLTKGRGSGPQCTDLYKFFSTLFEIF